MANRWYPEGVLDLLKDTLDVAVDNLMLRGVTSAYTYSTAHTTRSNTSANEIAGTETSVLASVTATNRVLDFTDPSLPDPGSGGPVDAYILFKRVGADLSTPADDKLIAYIDTDTGGAINLTLDGTDDSLTLNNDGDAKNGLLRLGGLDSTFTTGDFGLYGAFLQGILSNAGWRENLTTNLDRFFVVGIDPAAGTTYTPARNTDSVLTAVPADTEVTDHVQIDSGAAGSISFVSPRVRHDAPDTTLPNDASGTLKSLIIYYLQTGQTWTAAGPDTRGNGRLVAHVDVADTTMDGTSDTIQWASTGIWAIDDATNW